MCVRTRSEKGATMDFVTRLCRAEPTRVYDVVRRERGDVAVNPRKAELVVEHALDLFVNERLLSRLVCTPCELEELVLGHLLTEGIILERGDVEILHVCESGARAKVFLGPGASSRADAWQSLIVAGSDCTGSRTFVQPRDDAGSAAIPAHTWRPETVFALARNMRQGTALYASTRGAHSCAFATGSDILYTCEDIGRYNAVDKVVGCALRDGVALRHGVLFGSGRVPADMVRKAVRAGVPVLASHSVPTDAAVDLARRSGLTLLGSVTTRQLDVYAE
jgi:FdhD protein